MKKHIKLILWSGLMAMMLGFVSCEDYLDKDAGTNVSPTEAYKNFSNFQGFTEELYYCIPDFAKGYWTNSFNWGEDEITSVGINFHMGYKIDLGNFWGWQSRYDGWQAGFMDRNENKTTNDNRFHKSLWPLAWYGIRKANMGLENLDKLVDATTEERNIIKGQLLFFRAWFHFNLVQYFGGLPYIDKVLPGDKQVYLQRPSYHEVADRIGKDFREAADLLPADWDKTTVGKRTAGKNQLRINKIMALGYLGKNYLWAGSPLMNFESTGEKTYNVKYCKEAAKAFAELLTITESGESGHALVDFEKYSSIFYTTGQNWKMPGDTEAIFRGPSYEANGSNWGLSKQYTPALIAEGDHKFLPTANYVNYYGMANGLPLDDIDADFDPEHPWKDRDPRFYHDIVFDGVQCVEAKIPETGNDDDAAKEKKKQDRFANLYTGGSYRDVTNGSRTGYMLYKFIPKTANRFDGGYDWGKNLHIHLCWMRLADVYLMYAEAVANGYGSADSKEGDYENSAVDAVNLIRKRAGVDPVHAKFLGSVDDFMSELRRERAVELAYEGHRFTDLRRWMLLTEKPYTLKTSVEFDRASAMDGGFERDKSLDPKECKVLNFREVQILERQFSSKHYWLPLKNADVHMNLEFQQNSGW